MLHYIKSNRGNIKVLKSPQHLILTSSPSSIKDFLQQRKRWASKSRYYTDKTTIALTLIVFTANFALVALSFWGIYTTNVLFPIYAFLLKGFSDLILFWKGKDLYKYHNILILLPIITIIYPFYIVLTAFTSIKSPFEWKGRKHNN
jgi:cellulose synthase/poly-beta-1,6-N-acetylglucosamine synthase-like glycosyltransferase